MSTEAQKRAANNYNQRKKEAGFQVVRMWVHADNIEAVKDFAAAMESERLSRSDSEPLEELGLI